jgi:hypothetical protein
MAKKADLYQAKESFVTMLDDEPTQVSKGDLVRAGHPPTIEQGAFNSAYPLASPIGGTPLGPINYAPILALL